MNHFTLAANVTAAIVAVAIATASLAVGCARREPLPTGPLFVHPGSCAQCHTESRSSAPKDWKQTSLPRNRLCTQGGCHARFDEPHKHVHAPVAAGDCTVCHLPHSSNQPSLARAELKQLCATCHDPLVTCPSRESGGNCSDCHNAHHGDSPLFLQTNVAGR